MDRKLPAARREIECPSGVKLRTFKHGQRIQIAFSFRGAECRELMPPGAITQSAVTHATGLRAEILRKISLGTFDYAEYFPGSPRAQQYDAGGRRILISTLLEAQLAAYEQQVKNGTLAASTLIGYRKGLTGARMEHWKGKTVRDATPSALRLWIGSLGVTAKAARNLLTPLRSVFEDAVNDDLVEFNPFDRISLAKLLKQSSRASDYEVDPFTAAERAALLEHARADERAMLQFWFNTGLRPGELMALRWPKIDFVGKTARIDRNLVAGEEKGPKTKAGIRDVQLNGEAIGALIAQKSATFLAGEHVWHNPRSGAPWEKDAQIRRTLWQPLCMRAGVRYRNPYQVRHTFASAELTQGANPWLLAQQLGHVDVEMVFKIYGKFIAEDFQKPKLPALRLVSEQ
jgi:integrase